MSCNPDFQPTDVRRREYTSLRDQTTGQAITRPAGTILTNWGRMAILKRMTRAEKAAFPQQIPNVLTTIPTPRLRSRRTGLVVGTLMLATGLAGCLPTTPTCQTPEFVVQRMQPIPTDLAYEHHNLPVILLDGRVGYVCERQPRIYVRNGVAVQERDHYVQLGPCPAVPID